MQWWCCFLLLLFTIDSSVIVPLFIVYFVPGVIIIAIFILLSCFKLFLAYDTIYSNVQHVCGKFCTCFCFLWLLGILYHPFSNIIFETVLRVDRKLWKEACPMRVCSESIWSSIQCMISLISSKIYGFEKQHLQHSVPHKTSIGHIQCTKVSFLDTFLWKRTWWILWIRGQILNNAVLLSMTRFFPIRYIRKKT